MRDFEINALKESAIQYLFTIRDEINQSPVYQRVGDVWTKSKRQLLIDSILNGLDIPKIYFHQPITKSAGYDFSVVDGRQRIAAIFDFIENKFPISLDFEYFRDPSIDLKGFYYRDIRDKFPKIRSKFDAISLPIIVIRTDDLEIIEELFYRLNEATPLNAAERRNAFPGPIPSLIREVAGSEFFTRCLKVSDLRYRHYDIAAKFIYLTYRNRISDTKKIHLDKFAKDFTSDTSVIRSTVFEVLSGLVQTFSEKDDLLVKTGLMPVYYILSIVKGKSGLGFNLNRSDLLNFVSSVAQNRRASETSDIEDESVIPNPQEIDFELIEFDRLTQTPNDAYSIYYKVQVMIRHLFNEVDSQILIERLYDWQRTD